MSVDLFGSPTVVGIKVKLDRDIDRENPCHDNVAVIHPGKAQHAGERCAHCDRYRGWLPQSTCNFILETVRRFGAPCEPIIVRQHQQENKVAFQQKPNTGSLFKNRDKSSDTDRDYSGSLNLDGREFWLNGWIKKSKAGASYLSLSVKPKVEQAASKKPIREGLNDEIPAF
jgi:hypothetical protein